MDVLNNGPPATHHRRVAPGWPTGTDPLTPASEQFTGHQTAIVGSPLQNWTSCQRDHEVQFRLLTKWPQPIIARPIPVTEQP